MSHNLSMEFLHLATIYCPRAAISVSYVTMGRASGFYFYIASKMTARYAKRPISTILQKNRGLWTVYVNFLQSFARIISPDNVVCYALKW